MIEVVRNKLADYAHKAWSGWMDYLFKHGEMLEDGRFVIAEYIDLPENEKKSDLEEADKILTLIFPAIRDLLSAPVKSTTFRIPRMPGPKRDANGEPIMRILSIPLADLQIFLLDGYGNIVIPGMEGNPPIRPFNFEMEAPGIDPLRVVKVELPTLDYSSNGDALFAKVTVRVLEGDEQ